MVAGRPYRAAISHAAALAELRRGAAQGASDVLYISGEVGVGGGIIVDGRVPQEKARPSRALITLLSAFPSRTQRLCGIACAIASNYPFLTYA